MIRARHHALLAALALTALVMVVFWPVGGHDFIVVYDDNVYVTANPHVQAGLSWEGVRWAFTTSHVSNWHPLTWLSHMLDVELFGMDAGSHHQTSLLFHLLNTVVLFLVLHGMTGFLWRSAAVAALFGIHPLHVESVAWVAERKDVLSTFFWMLTMAAYWRYVRRPGAARYLAVAMIFMLGLMAKPMLVTLPFVLLLLDFWPLGRWAARASPAGRASGHTPPPPWRGLLGEKIPLFLMAAVSSVVTYFAQLEGGAMKSLTSFPLDVRLSNASLSCARYMGKVLWPVKLSVYYPHPGENLVVWQAVGAGVLVILFSLGALRHLRRFPFIAVGWFWYLGTLVPVIGLVQVGTQSIADRYTYVPLIGFFILLVWGGVSFPGNSRYRKYVTVLAVCLLVLAAARSRDQVGYWRNGFTLFEHAIAATAGNHVAHHNLGTLYDELGHYDKALEHYRRSLMFKPLYVHSHYNLGNTFSNMGRYEEATVHYQKALEITPFDTDALYNLGNALYHQGRYDEAVAKYREALRLRPEFKEARENLRWTLIRQGR